MVIYYLLVMCVELVNSILHSFFQSSNNLPKLTVIKELIKTLPGGRVFIRRVVQPVIKNRNATVFGILFFFPHLKLLPGNLQQVTYFIPFVEDLSY